jgi:hypothetical protein
MTRSKAEAKLPDSDMERIFKGFQESYQEHGVKIIGAWENADDRLEGYLITAYRDAAHYEEAVTKMRVDKRYQMLSEELQKTRESVKVVTLKTLPGSPEE